MRPASPRGFRRTASVVVTGLVAAGVYAPLPVPSAFADGTVTVVQPASKTVANGDNRVITFKTTDSWTPLGPPQVTLTRHNDPTHNDTVEGSGESVSSSDPTLVTATFDLKLANPADYDITIEGTSSGPPPMPATDTCVTSSSTVCLHVVQDLPLAVTSTSPNSVMAGDQYPNWVINGTGFTKGPYVQCTALPCDTSKPTVAVLVNGALDPDVTLTASDQDSTAKQIPLVLSVAKTDSGGYRSIQVTNTDGQTATCANCLLISAAMTATSISPDHLPKGSAGQTLFINGANFQPDVQVTFARQSDETKTGDVAWTSMTVTSSQITLNNVAISSNAPDGNETLKLHSESTHGNGSFPGLFAVGGSAPTPFFVEGPPTDVRASGGDQQAFVQWTPPQSSSSNPITGYVIRTLPSGDPSSPAPGNARSGTVGPLTNGQPYQFTVTVTYQNGNSYTSQASNTATPSGRPDSPTHVAATAGDRTAAVSWDPPASDGGTAIDSYTVTSSPDGRSATVFAQGFSAPPATTATVTGLKNGTTYTFTVVAHNRGGNSNDSEPSNAVTPIGDPTLLFRAPKAIDSGTSARLHGRLISSNGNPLGGAKVKLQQRHSGAHQFGTIKVLTTGKKGYWSFEVKPKTTTRYRVKWKGDAGNHPVVAGKTVAVRETGAITSPKDGAHRSAGPVTVRGHVTGDKGLPVALQQRVGGKWTTIENSDIGAHHKVAIDTTLAEGKVALRLKIKGEFGTITGYSKPVHITVS
jgi:hypothetical protein